MTVDRYSKNILSDYMKSICFMVHHLETSSSTFINTRKIGERYGMKAMCTEVAFKVKES